MKKLLPKLVILVVSTLVVLVAAEVVLRVAYDGKFGPRPRFHEPDADSVYRPAANLDHTFHGEDYRIHVATDDWGCRTGELGPVPPEAEVILLSGDSNTFGWGVDSDQTCGSILDVAIAKRTKGKVRVVNLGVGGYGSLQSSRRLAKWVREHPDRKVRAVVFIHSQNDVTDNPKKDTLAALIGVKRSLPEPVRNPSSLHLMNFCSHAFGDGDRQGQGDGTGGEVDERGFQDARWSYRITTVPDKPMPDQITIGDLTFPTADLVPAEWSVMLTFRRGEMTDLQRKLMQESISQLHLAVEGKDIPFYHTYIYTVPGWYVRDVDPMIAAARPHGNRVINLGQLPSDSSVNPEHVKSIQNKHKGGHFNPRFNRVWAKSIYGAMAQHDPELAGN